MTKSDAAIAFAINGILVCLSSAALACPEGQVEENVILGKICVPGIIVNPLPIPGVLLQEWIEQSHDTVKNGAQSIPPAMRRALAGFVPEDVLTRARFRVGDPGALNLAHDVLQIGDLGGNVPGIRAITLMDVIVFRNDDDAYTNAILWAHELTHVKEYGDWGTAEFARSYIANWRNVEDPAYQKQYEYPRWSTMHPPNFSTFHADYGNLHARILCISGAMKVEGIANDWNHKFLSIQYSEASSTLCEHDSGYEVNVVAPEGTSRTDILRDGGNEIAFVISPTSPEYSVRIQLYEWKDGHKNLVYDVQKDNYLGGQPLPVDFTYSAR